jgi:hypothetical protein
MASIEQLQTELNDAVGAIVELKQANEIKNIIQAPVT